MKKIQQNEDHILYKGRALNAVQIPLKTEQNCNDLGLLGFLNQENVRWERRQTEDIVNDDREKKRLFRNC